MYQSRPSSARDRKHYSTENQVFVQRASFDRRNPNRISGLRQVEEFSTSLKKIQRSVKFYTSVWIFFSLTCLELFLCDIGVIALFSAGSAVFLIQLAMIGTDYFHEGKRAAQAYWDYLDKYSHKVIMDLRQTSQLSKWSKHEVDKYLSAKHLWRA